MTSNLPDRSGRRQLPRRGLPRSSYGPEIDQKVDDLTRLLESLRGTLTAPSRDRRATDALLGRIDGRIDELRRVVNALNGQPSIRIHDALFERPRIDRRA